MAPYSAARVITHGNTTIKGKVNIQGSLLLSRDPELFRHKESYWLYV
jgi:hypothetical protein